MLTLETHTSSLAQLGFEIERTNGVILTMPRRSVLGVLLVALLSFSTLVSTHADSPALQLTMSVTIPSFDELGCGSGCVQCCLFDGATVGGDGRVFFSPLTSDYIGVYDTSNDTFSTLPMTKPDGAPYVMDWKFHSSPLTLPDGRVVFAPKAHCYIGVLNPTTNAFHSVHISGMPACNNALRGGVVMDDGRVLFIGYATGYIVIFDPVTNTATPVNTGLGANSFGALGAKAGDGRVVFPPFFADKFGIFDPDGDQLEMRSVEPMHTSLSTGYYRFYDAVTAGDGRVVFVPQQSLDVGIFNPWNDTFTTLRVPSMMCNDPAVSCEAALMQSGIQDYKGRVVMWSGVARHVLIFDHLTDTLHTVDADYGSFLGYAGALPDGRLVFNPRERDSVGIFDPSTDTYSTLGSGLEHSIFSGVTTTNDGRVVLVPTNGGGAVGIVEIPPCDASVPPQNGGVGTCGSNLPYGSSCAVECDDGYEATGLTTCSADGYVPASCVCSPHTVACCDAMNDMGLLQPTHCASCY